jgi:hypothetical protein
MRLAQLAKLRPAIKKKTEMAIRKVLGLIVLEFIQLKVLQGREVAQFGYICDPKLWLDIKKSSISNSN